MKDEIYIKNGRITKCPNCNKVISIENEDTLLIKNLSILYKSKALSKAELTCRNCKEKVIKNLT